ncbi:hypothetical protein Tco_1090779 [Tanacetum coccineum]|uniref:Uncharacterized protein n=1 Tax=Tanacetum coccineum TaxID=301880 RepID=A0ABQ5I6A4_9ASTR
MHSSTPFSWEFIPRNDLHLWMKIVESENLDVTTVVTPSDDKTVESNHESANVKSNYDAVESKTVRKNKLLDLQSMGDWNSDDESYVEFILKDKNYPKVNEEDAEEKTTEMDESGASNKDGEDDQATRTSNAFEEHVFKQFSPFKNAFTLSPVSNVTPMNDTGIFGNAYDDEDVGGTQKGDSSFGRSKLGRGNARGASAI